MRTFAQTCFLLTFSLSLFSVVVCSAQQDAGSIEARKPQSITDTKQASFNRWRKLLDTWKRSRDRLKSGSVLIEGEEVLLSRSAPLSGEPAEEKWRVHFQLEGSFDYELGFQKWIATNYWGYENLSYVTLFAPDQITTWCSTQKLGNPPYHINLWRPDAKLPGYAIYWFPLSAGLSRISSGGKIPKDPYGMWYRMFRKWEQEETNQTIAVSTDEVTGLTKVKITTHAHVNKRPCISINGLLFNEQQGCTLIEHSTWVYPQEVIPPKRPFSHITVTWNEIDSVWVPISVRRSSSSGRRTQTLKLKWDKVNDPVDAEILNVGAPEGTTTVDLRYRSN